MIHTLTYWVCENLDDSKAYNLRARTRREVVAMRAEYGVNAERFSKPFKVEMQYRDAFDLVARVLGEGGGEYES